MAKTRANRKDRKDRKTRKNRKDRKNRSRKQEGGKRKGNAWTRKVTDLYRKMKKEDPSTRFTDALKRASKMKKAGQL